MNQTIVQTHTTTSTSILKRLRSLIPPARQDISFDEAFNVAERQATLLGQLLAAETDSSNDEGITEAQLADLPRIRITREVLMSVGSSHWNGQEWIICLNRGDPLTRQRFTLLHEFKHIIDHGAATRLYRGDRRHKADEQAEIAADYFAGCALVPKRQLKAAWGNGIQRPELLAEHFSVSLQAMQVRLSQTGLDRAVDPKSEIKRQQPRCARPVWTPWGQTQRFRIAVPAYTTRSY